MIIFQVVFVGAERGIVGSREKMLVLADVKRRQTNFAEFEIVRAINAAFLRARIWNHLSSLSFRGSGEHIVEIRESVAGVFDVTRFTPNVQGVDVDVGYSSFERIKRMLGVPFCPKESGFFGRC